MPSIWKPTPWRVTRSGSPNFASPCLSKPRLLPPALPTETAMAKRRQKTISKKKTDDRLRMLVVEARYYNHIADALLKGATAALEEAGAEVDCVEVPGALEIPPAIAIAA